MDDQTQKEIKSKVRQIRSDFTRAQNLIKELNSYYTQFEDIRAKLDSREDGLEANFDWSRTKRDDIERMFDEVTEKSASLDSLLQDINSKSSEVNASFEKFNEDVAAALDSETGVNAIHSQVQSFRDSASTLSEAIKTFNDTASANVDKSTDIRTNIESDFKEFKALIKQVNAPKNGIAANLERAKKALDNIEESRKQAQLELAAVTSIKDQGANLLEEITNDRASVKGLQKESQNLTEDIRNTLGLTSSKSLSASFGTRSSNLDKSLIWWGFAVAFSILLLIGAIATIFYSIYLMEGRDTSPTFTSVLAKTFFSSPFVFAVYFSVTNFNHTRNLRDKYSFKETIAKSLQAYIKLLRTEFEDTADGNKEYYRKRRLSFSLDNMETIYKEPLIDPAKRKYAFGLNRFFNVTIEEDDTRTLEKRVADTVTEFVDEQSSHADEVLAPNSKDSNGKK